MKMAIFSDVHGNFLNLESFYNTAVELGVEDFVCLGDLVNYYPENSRVIDFIIEKKIRTVLGNHDELYSRKKGIGRSLKEIYRYDDEMEKNDFYINYLEDLPSEIVIKGEKNVLFCHGSPHNFTNGYVYPDTSLKQFDQVNFDIIFMGHTHRQFLRNHENKTFCNVGSIGLPRDNGLLMGFAIFDREKNQIELYRKKIDADQILSRYGEEVHESVIELMYRNETIEYPYTLIDGTN